MQPYRWILTLSLMLGATARVGAQPRAAEAAPYTFYYKIADNQLWVRWAPGDVEHFRHAIAGKLTAALYGMAGDWAAPDFRLLWQQQMQPLGYTEWRAALSAGAWDSIALAAVHAESLDAALLNESFLAPEYGDTEAEAWHHRAGVSNYALNYSWAAIARSGMGFSRPLDPDVKRYALRLFPGPMGDTLFFDIDAEAYQPPATPELEARYKGSYAELKWRTDGFEADFFGWGLDRSADGGREWTPVFALPLVSQTDSLTRAAAGEAARYAYHNDPLPDASADIRYRLRGADYLGGWSQNFSEVSRVGREDITLSPLLLKTTQTDSNYAHIEWAYDPGYEPLLAGFRIVVADTAGGSYRIALDGIEPTAREASLWMPFRSNFFRVQAVSKLGTVLSSFESLVMMYDDEPPAVPARFTGYIDSTGLAHLSWAVSEEEDLAGYYLFKGYFERGELAMITPEPLAGPAHVDTVNMETGNEWVYYRLRSVDSRGNGSDFSPLLALKKPDRFPPAAGRITAIRSTDQAIQLHWTRSPSPDVAAYRIYRRVLNETDAWTLLLAFDAPDFVADYTDTLVEAGKAYQYAAQAIDDDGLVSELSQPVSMRLKDYGLRGQIESFTAAPNAEARAVALHWQYGLDAQSYYLYRAQGNAPLSLLKILPGGLQAYTDENLRRGETYRYVLRAYLADGKTSPFSAPIDVIVE